MDLAPIIQRLKDRVPDLGQRVAGAAEFAVLTSGGAAPQVTPAVHVVPAAIIGGKATAGTGMYIQSIDEFFSCILTLRTQDPSGQRALPRLSQLIDDVIAALAGWSLGDKVGVIVFRRSTLAKAEAGAFSYEISFSIADQLRIAP
ncbi:MAG: hypothetical protein JWS10_930 [Cypionkella sp.]|uniref:phage tail terminator protein n=1 Tax=Cypionkella sp. TaxID=2811411 RepID=UPI002618B731|nr:hypothetical protein [Cypionkella sp.]MDB5658315.1 hypothetical protein [Cypionkella sp.]